jgi:hypothetical protein
MGTITIQFVGICTQIKLPEAVGTTLHRAVMVHAEVGAVMEGMWIPPHRTFLMINPTTLRAANLGALQSVALQQDGNWQLLGTRLTVQDYTGDGVTYEQSMEELPSLTTLTPDFGPLSQTVVYGPDAAGHFDVASGTFSGGHLGGSSLYAALVVNTSTDDVVLALQDLAMPENTGTLTFLSGSTIVIANTGGSLLDKPWDFLLHYLTAETMPPDARYPGESARGAMEVLGPGCSNSNFP